MAVFITSLQTARHCLRRVLGALLLVAPLQAASADTAVRFAVLSISPPAVSHQRWQPFANYISERLGQRVELIVPRGFEKMRQAVVADKVDFFYSNAHVFYRIKEAGKAIGVVQMQNIKGEIVSRSEIFVRADSDIGGLGDLKNRRIAFVSPLGAGGYMAPRAAIQSAGLVGNQDVEEVFTKNLTNTLHGVLLGEYDAGAMCGGNYFLMSQKIDTGELRVLAVSERYPENLIAARTGVSGALISRFREAVLSMKSDPKGREVLQAMHSMKIRNFVPYDPAVENMTRVLLEKSRLH